MPRYAVHMFARWTQENFFRYMRQDYRLDTIVQNTVDQIDKDFSIVDPEYNNVSYKFKKIREKIQKTRGTKHPRRPGKSTANQTQINDIQNYNPRHARVRQIQLTTFGK